jgi:phage gpG-like protein
VIELQVIGREQLQARISGATANVRAALRGAIQASVIDMEAQVKEKLSGPVLKVRTGRLRNSVTSTATEDGDTITGTVGANTPYAAVHEYGDTYWMPPRMQTIYRKTVRGELQARFVKRADSNFASDHGVRGHIVRMPERSYLRSTLAENAEAIRTRIRLAVAAGLKQ